MLLLLLMAMAMTTAPIRGADVYTQSQSQSAFSGCFEDPYHILNVYHRGTVGLFQNPDHGVCTTPVPTYMMIVSQADTAEFYPYVGVSISLATIPANYTLTGLTYSGITYSPYTVDNFIGVVYSSGCEKLTPAIANCDGCEPNDCDILGTGGFFMFGVWPSFATMNPPPPGAQSVDILFRNVGPNSGNIYFGNFAVNITNTQPPYDSQVFQPPSNHVCMTAQIPVFQCSCPNCCLTCQ